ncbi:MAG: type IIL restriction-modification enzyme MmeI [Isosphaeraceae bacterium]
MPKPPSWNEIRSRATAFSSRWAADLDENAGAQSFWNEFLVIFGVDRKRVATFEARARRSSTGGAGRIDLFWPGVLVAEHKSRGADLENAEQQAMDYLESIDQLGFPGVVLCSDFARIRIRDLAGTTSQSLSNCVTL